MAALVTSTLRPIPYRRGKPNPAAEAQTLYTDLQPPPGRIRKGSDRPPAPARRERGAGRPTKADRRAIERLRDDG